MKINIPTGVFLPTPEVVLATTVLKDTEEVLSMYGSTACLKYPHTGNDHALSVIISNTAA